MKAIRRIVLTAAPAAMEDIKYGMPVFCIGPDYLCCLGGWKTHVATYPVGRYYNLEGEIAPLRAGKDRVKFVYGRDAARSD
ncbi:DUF1801 domain-containing protein [Asticcacaulis sp.]|uniref:DUF1801 domain-containing protein n=1 Tax=Asticcacaulis sp. TaxID=1872648 RepID=UPI0031CFE628